MTLPISQQNSVTSAFDIKTAKVAVMMGGSSAEREI